MPDTSQYLDIMIRAPSIRHDLHARLLGAVHRCVAQDNELAVSWPDWKDQPADFGLLFRIFGAYSALEKIMYLVQPLAEAELVRLYPILQTPSTSLFVTHWRDRSAEKKTESYILRENRHRETRELNPTTRTPVVQAIKWHFLKMYSDRTKQRYSLFVGRELGASPHVGGHSYGLGHAVPSF